MTLRTSTLSRLVRFLLVSLLLGSAYSFPGGGLVSLRPISRDDADMMNEARQLKSAGLMEEAVKSYSILLLMARADQNETDEAECLMSLGALLWDKGDLEKSAKYYSEALNIAKAREWSGMAHFCEGALDIFKLYKSGKSFRDQMQYDSSERCYLQAIGISRRIESAGHEAKCLRQLSIVFYYRMEWDRYYLTNKAAFDLSDKNNLAREKAHCAFNIAYFYLKTGRYHDAHAQFGEAKKIYRRLGADEDEAECDHNIALIYHEIGNYEHALRKLSAIFLRIKDDGLRTAVLISMGNAAKKLALLEGDRRALFEAASCYRKALDLAIRRQDGFHETVILNNLGYFYYELDNLPLALSYFVYGRKASRRIPNADLKCAVMANIANVYLKMEDYELAEKHYRSAMRLLRPEKHQAILWEAFFGLGKCYQQKRQKDQALSCYLKAMDMLEELAGSIPAEQDKANYLFNKYEVYEAAINLLFDGCRAGPGSSGDGKTMVSIIDRLRSKTLLDSLISRYDSHRLEYPGGGKGGVYEDITSEAAGVSVGDKLKLLTKNAALLMFYVGDAVSLSLLMTADKIQCYRLPPRDKLEKSIAHYLKLLSAPPRDEFQGTAAAHKIFNDLFGPGHERRLAGIKNIVVIPDGVLSYLPFETLVKKNTAGGAPVYLMDEYSISYAPSMSSLYVLSNQYAGGNSPGKVLMVGKSDYREYGGAVRDEYLSSLRQAYDKMGVTLGPLRGVVKEAKNISLNVKRDKFTMRLDDSADEESIKHEDMSKYRVVHFACHGLIDEDFPMRSSLVLTRKRESGEDGHLQVHEIYALGLKADLVVLSACRTGRGKLSRGEGVMGLAKTFFYAGAKSVLSTLWNVNDESTAVFMKYFYANLSRGMAKNEALRRAKLRMIDSGFSHPYYWAPFVLSGDYASSCGLN